MKTIFLKPSCASFIYFLFYILLSTSAITSLVYLPDITIGFIMNLFNPDPYFMREVGNNLYFGLPPLIVVIICFILIHGVKSNRLFFTLTFIIAAVSHFLLSRSTNVSLNDIRLVFAATVYLALLSTTLTTIRTAIQKQPKFSYVLLIPMAITIGIGFRQPAFFDHLYMSFAWKLDSIDNLFGALSMDFYYFMIVVMNIFSCLITVSVLTAREFITRRLRYYVGF